MTGVIWEDDLGKDPKPIDIPADMLKPAQEAREQMVEKIAELDDNLTVKYLEGAEISIDELKSALRKAIVENKAYPVLCGSSLKNKGVQVLLDAVIDYLPSLQRYPRLKVRSRAAASSPLNCLQKTMRPLSALVFKIVTDPYVGRLAYFRVYSGVISQGQMVTIPQKASVNASGA